MKRSKSLFKQFFAVILLLCLTTTVVWSQQPATATKPNQTLTATEKETSNYIKADKITEITTKLSSPEMEGRGTATPGGEKAAKYIAERFQQMGLKPLGDNGSYLQAIKFNFKQVSDETSVKVGDTALKHIEEFGVLFPQPNKDVEVTGDLVFAGYGVTAPDIKHDDYANLDVKGKIVVILFGKPKTASGENAKAFNPSAIIANLLKRGAAGLIISDFGTSSFTQFAKFLAQRKLALPGNEDSIYSYKIPLVIATKGVIEKLVAESGSTLAQLTEKAENNEYVSCDLKKSATIKIKMKLEESVGNNVVGLLEGSDEKLKQEALTYSAHYDAFGMKDGQLHPGAADNALGVAMMMSLAEAFTKAPKPRRSVIFLAVTGEELGLLGSEYWANHPTWPIEKVAANINFDGIGVETYGPVKKVAGFGMDYSDLGEVLEDSATALGCRIISDPFPEEKVFYRSDHFSFVRKGIPSVMLLGAPAGDIEETLERAKKYLNTDYHKPTDTIKADWNWEGPRQLAVVGFVMGLRVANADKMPEWRKDSEFNNPRGKDLKPKGQE